MYSFSSGVDARFKKAMVQVFVLHVVWNVQTSRVNKTEIKEKGERKEHLQNSERGMKLVSGNYLHLIGDFSTLEFSGHSKMRPLVVLPKHLHSLQLIVNCINS